MGRLLPPLKGTASWFAYVLPQVQISYSTSVGPGLGKYGCQGSGSNEPHGIRDICSAAGSVQNLL